MEEKKKRKNIENNNNSSKKICNSQKEEEKEKENQKEEKEEDQEEKNFEKKLNEFIEDWDKVPTEVQLEEIEIWVKEKIKDLKTSNEEIKSFLKGKFIMV